MTEWLWQLIPWGYEILLRIQEWHSPLLDTFFSALTWMGSEWFYIGLLPILYWTVSRQLGLGLAYVYLTSTYFNGALKETFAIPRPIDPVLEPTLQNAGITKRLDPLFSETSPSWPSNHSQGAFVTWGYLAWWLKRGWFWPLAVLFAAFIAFSRLYGGVHFPQDVIGGVLLGAAYLTLWVVLQPGVQVRLSAIPWPGRLAAAIVAPLLGYLFYPSETGAQIAGTLLGMGAGYLLEARWIGFQVAGRWWQRVLRVLLGLVLLLAFYAGLKVAFSGAAASLVAPLRLLRYTLVGGSASVLAPWLFVRLGLAAGKKELS